MDESPWVFLFIETRRLAGTIQSPLQVEYSRWCFNPADEERPALRKFLKESKSGTSCRTWSQTDCLLLIMGAPRGCSE